MRGWLCSVALLLASPAAFAEYTFQISNNTDSKIVAIHVSEDGNTWGEFNIGSGIAAGATATMQWDESTDDSGCVSPSTRCFSIDVGATWREMKAATTGCAA